MTFARRPVEQRRDDQRGPVAPDEPESQVHVHRRETAVCHRRQAQQRSQHTADDQRGAAHAALERVHRQIELVLVTVCPILRHRCLCAIIIMVVRVHQPHNIILSRIWQDCSLFVLFLCLHRKIIYNIIIK